MSCPICLRAKPFAQLQFPCPNKDVVCLSCANTYIEKKIADANHNVCCPICQLPDMREDSAEATKYGSQLYRSLRVAIDIGGEPLIGKLERLLANRRDMFDPGYRRCPKCTEGFIDTAASGPAIAAQPTAARCPHCQWQFCGKCLEKWVPGHATMDIMCGGQMARLQLRERNAADADEAMGRWRASAEHVWFRCARCKTPMIVEPPCDCLHMHCSCSHESCRGCNQPYHRQRCPPSQRRPSGCEYSGLHCHHPRYCAYYLRDHSCAELRDLLRTAGVAIPVAEATATATAASSSRRSPVLCCGRDFNADGDAVACGQRVAYAAYQCCERHSQLLLAQLVREHRVDPLPLLTTVQQCQQELRRLLVPLPERDAYDDDAKYREKCAAELRKYPLCFD